MIGIILCVYLFEDVFAGMVVLFALQPLNRAVGVFDIDVGAMFEEASSRSG